MNKIRIISLNVRGLRNKYKRIAIFNYLKTNKFDIVCLQETHLTEKDVPIWEKQWGGSIFYNEGTNRSKGEIILISRHFPGNVELIISEDRTIAVSVTNENMKFNLVNAYAPNNSTEKIAFFRELEDKCSKLNESNLIILGDFNCVLDNELDIISGQPHGADEVNEFNKLVKTLDLTDTWRAFHREEKQYTWNRSNPFIARRLDYCFTSDSMTHSCVSSDIVTTPCTDHKAVITEFSTTDFKRGPGYWKFNNSYLKNPLFIEKMNSMLEQYTIDSHNENMSNIDRWELCKVEIRNFSIEFGKKLACQKRNDYKTLQMQISAAEKILLTDPNNKEASNHLLKLKQNLELLHLDKAKGAQIRSRVKWIEEGERNTKYFCSLEKSRGRQKVITRLQRESGETVSDQNEVLQEQVSFYKELYNQKTRIQDVKEATGRFIENIAFPRLEEIEANSCEGTVSIEETTNALKNLRNGSAPGSDGITIEFLKFFWNKLATIVTESFVESFHTGELSYTQKQGIITLLHKGKDLDRENLNNWRPITLTNSDYKILAKALSARLGQVIQKLIDEDQVGFFKGRNIATVIRTIDDAINYINNTNKAGYVLALDFYKAFDSVSKPFLIHVFEMFGFGPDFKKWVTILNTGNFSSINHGGWLSEPFDVCCGIRQGCPFSPLSFVLAVELLAIKIRNSTMEGIELPASSDRRASNLKIKQMADDTTLFLKNKEEIKVALSTLKSFESFSGLKLNLKKTKALRIGTQNEEGSIPITVVNKIKILGIHFDTNRMAINIEENWVQRMERIKELIIQWSKRDLSIQGKMVVIKTFLISQFVYVMQSIGLPLGVLTKLNTLLYKFLWQKRYSNRKAFEKVKRKIMESDIDQGGLNMINMISFQEYFHLQWAGKLFEATDKQNWSQLPKWHCEKLAKNNHIFEINSRSKNLKGLDRIENSFWKEVIRTYVDNKTMIELNEVTETNFLNQMIFNNRLITYKNKMLFFQNWQRQGIEKLKHIIHPTENRLLSLDEMQNTITHNRANTIIEYNISINSLPKTWILWINRGERETDTITCDASRYNTKPKAIKKLLLDDKEPETPCAAFFWQRKLGFHLDEQAWARAKNVSKETRLRVLHWKILHNIYPTNIMLSKMKITENDKCSYCKDITDYIEHFFCDCPVVHGLWEFVEHTINLKTNAILKLSVTDKLFGVTAPQLPKETHHYINLLILIAKMCISIYKKTKSVVPLQFIFEREMNLRSK